jgi:hypothetical protein
MLRRGPLGRNTGVVDAARRVSLVSLSANDSMSQPEALLTAAPAAGVDQSSARVSSRRSWWIDAAIAVGLGLVAFLYRRTTPSDGFFFDDAWQAFAAEHGSFSQLLTVGQTQPGFGLLLMVWSRLAGGGTVSMIAPAAIAGCLGPPALYLALRRFRFARPVAFLLGAALVVSATHIIYSGRVKVYTAEVLVVLLVAVALPWFVRRSWRPSTAVLWFAAAMVVSSFSSFSLLAAVAAGVVVVLRPHGDRRLRISAVAAQGAGTLVWLAVVDRTHSAELLNAYFNMNDGFFKPSLNPASVIRQFFHHLTRITTMFPGGPALLGVVLLVLAAVGLIAAAVRRGKRGVAAQFMLVMVGLALVGAIAHRVPFGPNPATYRVALWMAPIVAFGLAVVLQRTRRFAVERGRALTKAFDAVVVACAVLLLFTALGTRRAYPSGVHELTGQVMARVQPSDAVLVTRYAMFSFALDAGTPVRVQPAPEKIQGMIPRFADKRIIAVDFLDRAQVLEVDRALRSARRVFVVDSGADPPGYTRYRDLLDTELRNHGFTRVAMNHANRAMVATWIRA